MHVFSTDFARQVPSSCGKPLIEFRGCYMVENMSSARRVRVRALQTSALVMTLTLAAPAFAQCVPDPTLANSITTCTGTDVDGIRVTTLGTTVSVVSGATVSNAGGSAITIEVPNTVPMISETVVVSGQVDGGTQSGIALLTGPASTYNGSTTRLALTVTDGATLSGTTGLAMGQTGGSLYGMLLATVDNAGTISGSSSVALRGDVATTAYGFTTAWSAFDAITNRMTGRISGSIVGPVAALDNAGLIDGGSGSALTTGNADTRYPYTINPGTWTNSGTIRSNGTAATIVSATISTLTNSGTIANAGTGAALSSSFLVVQNQAGGQISSGGTTAIDGTGYLNLVNRGTITGSVLTGNSSSLIDSSQGRINGSIMFGSGNDTLVVGYDGTATPVTGITGTIDAGRGINTQQLAIGSDTTIVTPIALLTGFEQFAIATDKGVTTTLGTGFVAPTTIQVVGAGSFVNRAAIATTGTAFVLNGVSSPEMQRFRNEGSIQTGSGSAYAINGFSSEIVNAGSIVSAGGGITSSQARVVNAGTIAGVDTGVEISGNSLTNSGTIRSTAGVGVRLSGNVGTLSTNSGTIQGAQAGVQTSAYLANTGSITAINSNGVAVVLDAYGVVFNNAGGVIGNGGQAITGTLFNESVVNAGTINGQVSLTYADQGRSSQRYISQAGGVLNGNLVLGSGGLLFTDLVNTGPGLFAGITGSVTATSGAMLRYRVAGAQSAVLGPIGPFANAAYELTDGATLTLTAPGTITQQVLVAGTGSIDLYADLTSNTVTSALAVDSILATQASYGSPTGVLAISSHGTITVARTIGGASGGAGVSLGGDDSFINFGTITVTDRNANANSAGIVGGVSSGSGTVTNAGSILLDGGIGISGAKVTNTGIIAQVDGGAAARGVVAGTLDNRGTIRVGGVAATAYNRGQIVNSGVLASTGGIAISGNDTSTSAAITNASGGTITGTGGTAVRLYYGTFTNAGAVNGSVDMGYGFPYYSGAPTRSLASSTFVAAGGTITGDLLFGDGSDLLLQTGDTLGVSGIVDGGAGRDIYGRVLDSSGAIAIDFAGLRNFEDALIQAVGLDTVATVTAPSPFTGDLYLAGNGSIINKAVIAGRMTTELPYDLSNPFETNPLFPADQTLVSITNAGSIAGGASVRAASFTNTGAIGTAALANSAVSISQSSAVSFNNSGTLENDGSSDTVFVYASDITFANGGGISAAADNVAVSLQGYYNGSVRATNSGIIAGGLTASSYGYGYYDTTPPPASVSLANSGTITRASGTAVALFVDSSITAGTVSLNNSGTIETTGNGGIGALIDAASQSAAGNRALDVVNSGTIRANGDTSIALLLDGNGPAMATLVNASGGLIEATGTGSTAILSYNAGLDLTNAGTIRTGSGTGRVDMSGDFSGAIQLIGSADGRIVNTGTIIGSIGLAEGNDAIENHGRIEGDVFLGLGDDSFLQLASATLLGTVDGGAGLDHLIVDATGGGAVNGDQFINFERFSQIGQGSVAYSGSFHFDTIGVSMGTVTIAAGETLASNGPITLTGSDAAETVTNNGTIAGSVMLLGGNDRFVNAGMVDGAVSLGDGEDEFVEQAGSHVVGGVNGGAGNDLYTIVLAGNHSGLGARIGFERLGITGSGTLSLTLDQSFDEITLAGTELNLALAGYTVGAVTGSAAAETLSVAGDIASISLGAGDDRLTLGTTRATGRYDGGAGNDTVRFDALTPVTLAGSATGFEQVELASSALTVEGTLGTAGAALSFGAGDQRIIVANGATLAGMVDLGAGDDSVRLAATGTVNGTISGGTGTDVATIELAGNRTLSDALLSGFETLAIEGAGMLSLSGGQAYDRVLASGNLTIAVGASLVAPHVVFAEDNNRFTISGTFSGSVDGGAGTDAIAVSGGSPAAPVAFGSVANVEAFTMSGGFATVSGMAAFGSTDLTGGRLVGLAGSTIGASQIFVRQGATFGSAGTVNANLTVAGTLSPGASPGTMTVNGNVALQSGSVSLFEITPTVSDKLVINGSLSIAQGATLQIVAAQAVTPGQSLDLITVSGGITGSYTNVVKPASLFGFVVQRENTISLLGQFLNDPGYTPQVRGAIDYVNGVLVSGAASDALLTAVPDLVTASGASDQAAFARLTPEAYASATQIAVEQGLELANVGRSDAFAPRTDGSGAYTFASALGSTRTLESGTHGTSQARTNGYGFLGGIGWGGEEWSLGAFVGYLDSRQTLAPLGARTELDAVVAGIHGRWSEGSLGIKATVAYNGGNATTHRALPGGSARGDYDLKGWIADISLDYAAPLGPDWTVRPSLGMTAIRVTREGVAEAGGSAYALDVARERDHALFVDAGMTFQGGMRKEAALRPYLTLGVRYQVEGRTPHALAALDGGGFGLGAAGALRAPVVASATVGSDLVVSSRLTLFGALSGEAGNADNLASGRVGLRFAF